ncbi:MULTISPECIES: recombinase [unclassified Sphingobacterium]|uniref:recombinase n=1 Tax=unclassified Sphingobacterium TaxID=2609468 RepID=UPI001048CFA2|nr:MULTISPECIES: recombinase [unclassified Sphingobacterium]MCS3556849.1 site-specific recombinase [Sphingobacterium sp. JUb21]TCQ99226.1 site-specific recombinase [Sphingobacterium sp. JUb20]
MREKVNASQEIKQLFERFEAQLSDPAYIELDFLAALIDIFRPKRRSLYYQVDIAPLLIYLEASPDFRFSFSSYVRRVIDHKDFDQLISDTGIISYADFRYEIKKRITEKYLPSQPPKSTLQYVLNQLFYHSQDADWVAVIPNDQLQQLYLICDFNSLYESDVNFEIKEILYGLEVLVQRITGRAMETDVNKMVPEFQNFDSPFIAIMREFSELNDRFLAGNLHFMTSDDLAYKQILVLHKQCENYIDTAFANSHRFGISIKVNQSLLRIRQQLERIKAIISFLVIDKEQEKVDKSIAFAQTLIGYNCRKSNIRKLVGQSTQLLAYEITHHTAQTGEHYITSSKKEYWNMFRSACGGGIIVGVMCILKLFLGKVETSEFGHALLYSINYAIGFTAIYLFGATLATKQPAMTASALVAAIENGASGQDDTRHRYWNFAVFFARLFRSQFIAFVGNVIMAFPVSLVLIWGIQELFHYNAAAGKWMTLVNDLNPTETPMILHACIAGVFLFLSGIIAGSISNRDKHNSVYYRIEEQPVLKKVFGKEKTAKVARFYEKKWAGIVSNIWFGVFMGTTASVGMFLGLNLDIRHITFASGNLALGLFGNNMSLTTDMWIWGILGIGLIGFFNFAVSFSLSLTLAFRSRNLSFGELIKMAKAVWIYFKISPRSFFFPPQDKS